jgi:hypothetical protein
VTERLAIPDKASNSGFRVTTWPSHPLPHPAGLWAVRRYRAVVDVVNNDGVPKFVPDGEPARSLVEWVPLGTETYLELANVDPRSLEEMLKFIRRYGVLNFGLREEDRGLGVWQGMLAEDEERLLTEGLSAFAYGAATMRDLVTAWRVVNGDIAWEDAEWVAPLWGPGPLPPPAIAAHLGAELSERLKAFPPAVHVGLEGQTDPAHPLEWQFRPVLYEICCLELFNHMVERSKYRICPVCHRLFVRHQGRAAAGQHRSTGITFCSTRCTNYQSQKNFRRRRRERQDG